ncbi:hypothetical protein PR048_005822 [Dryococelus australis]|uniref:Uncharacterized protein n=1 Tax=Dryococelus australis TaxID=614101 RepID=A0ABQ9I9A1_9NEOP|nr:hypothetical protein PR048_005822 [Dryococelus australis]
MAEVRISGKSSAPRDISQEDGRGWRVRGNAPECKGRGNMRSLRKSADQRHRLARFTHAKSGSYPDGNRTRFALVGVEISNHVYHEYGFPLLRKIPMMYRDRLVVRFHSDTGHTAPATSFKTLTLAVFAFHSSQLTTPLAWDPATHPSMRSKTNTLGHEACHTYIQSGRQSGTLNKLRAAPRA